MSRPVPSVAVRPHVCTACSLLCDDVQVRVDGERVVSVEPACPKAVERLTSTAIAATCAVGGKAADYERAVAAAAELLAAAKMPVVTGLQYATVAAMRAAIELAERLGATIDPIDDRGRSGEFAAVQSVGAVTATLGEIAARADLVVNWFADPVATHPRLRERLGDSPTLGAATGATRQWIDVATKLQATDAAESARVLRALLQDAPLDEQRAETTAGVPLAKWRDLADQLAAAKYVAFVFDETTLGVDDRDDQRRLAKVALAELVAALHQHTRCVALPLAPGGNLAGVRQTLTWQTGFPGAVTFASGAPEYHPDEATGQQMLARGEADAVLVVGGDPLGKHSTWSPTARDAFCSTPTIVIDSTDTATRQAAAVALAVRPFHIAEAGSVFRTDGVALPLAAAVDSHLPSCEQVLRDIAAALLSRGG